MKYRHLPDKTTKDNTGISYTHFVRGRHYSLYYSFYVYYTSGRARDNYEI